MAITAEKVGMMLIDTMNAAAYGEINATHVDYIEQQKMNRFIFGFQRRV